MSGFGRPPFVSGVLVVGAGVVVVGGGGVVSLGPQPTAESANETEKMAVEIRQLLEVMRLRIFVIEAQTPPVMCSS